MSTKVRKPHLPFCTQACLLGLAQDRPLDRKCPNVQLHRQAQVDEDASTHPITKSQLMELVRQQLRWTPECDIECLYNQGYGGAIGFLLRITVTDYGYTFVAKGVEYEWLRRLQRESRIYEHLQSQQGVCIPVHLGLIRLLGAYPLMEYFKVLPYMMLLSYAGEGLSVVQGGLAPFWIPTGVHLELETDRTIGELWRLGLRDGDSNKANVLWCSETQRVMKIDFDRAKFVSPAESGNGLGDAAGNGAGNTHENGYGNGIGNGNGNDMAQGLKRKRPGSDSGCARLGVRAARYKPGKRFKLGQKGATGVNDGEGKIALVLGDDFLERVLCLSEREFFWFFLVFFFARYPITCM